MRICILICFLVVFSGCASPSYRETKDAAFSGAIDVRWVSNDYFLFLPNKDNPFQLVRQNGQSIQPGPMYTDGGSIPRFFWGVPGYSPWGYAPAYIIHDWLFVVKNCGYDTAVNYSFQDSVHVLAEGLKAVMESNPKMRNYFVFDSVVASIASPIAKKLWEHGDCDRPPVVLMPDFDPDAEPPGELIMTIEF